MDNTGNGLCFGIVDRQSGKTAAAELFNDLRKSRGSIDVCNRRTRRHNIAELNILQQHGFAQQSFFSGGEGAVFLPDMHEQLEVFFLECFRRCFRAGITQPEYRFCQQRKYRHNGAEQCVAHIQRQRGFFADRFRPFCCQGFRENFGKDDDEHGNNRSCCGNCLRAEHIEGKGGDESRIERVDKIGTDKRGRNDFFFHLHQPSQPLCALTGTFFEVAVFRSRNSGYRRFRTGKKGCAGEQDNYFTTDYNEIHSSACIRTSTCTIRFASTFVTVKRYGSTVIA